MDSEDHYAQCQGFGCLTLMGSQGGYAAWAGGGFGDVSNCWVSGRLSEALAYAGY